MTLLPTTGKAGAISWQVLVDGLEYDVNRTKKR
jgi:hypothetical protein